MNKHEIVKQITALLEQLVDGEITVEEEVQTPSADENIDISMNVSGTPDLHKRDPELFEKMAKYFDPEREPFTSDSWMRTGLYGVDLRPFKPTIVMGIEARRVSARNYGSEWHKIARGYFEADNGSWYHRCTAEDGVTKEEIEHYFRTCPMEGLDTRRWPAKYREWYTEGE